MENSKPVAIVLGGTFPHIELIRNLVQRGYYTVLVDYLDSPPAKEYADEHVQESTLDKEIVLKIAIEKNADLVISVCIDQANVTACFVGEKLGLPVPYSYKTSLNVTDKILMKTIMIDNGIPTSRFKNVLSVNDCKNLDLTFPLIVKPTDSNSSKGVVKVTNQNELEIGVTNAINISRNNIAIVEEFVEGKEIGIDCFINENEEAKVLITKERVKINSEIKCVQQIKGCIWPENIENSKTSLYENIATKISKSFGLKNTPLMIQAIVKNDSVNVIEFGARFGGGESFRIINLATNFDIIDASVDSFLGKKVDINISRPNYYYSDNFIYTSGGYFGGLVNYQSLLDDDTIEYIDVFKSKFTLVGESLSSNNRVGVFTVKSKNKNELMTKINKSVNSINVVDKDGKLIMRKDIY